MPKLRYHPYDVACPYCEARIGVRCLDMRASHPLRLNKPHDSRTWKSGQLAGELRAENERLRAERDRLRQLVVDLRDDYFPDDCLHYQDTCLCADTSFIERLDALLGRGE